MSKSFKIESITDPDINPFDRQERISWWSQDKLSQAKALVVGAGAIGNETLKNLALLGVGNIFIVDFDEISTSNLSRTVLFRRGDEGKRKAEVAAERLHELSLASNFKVDFYHGDAVWDLGTGLYREMDIVLGCLDNVETRFAVNRQCYLAGTPWIDAGIFELGLRVNFYDPPNGPCYECEASESMLNEKRKRYSCDDFKKKVVSEGKVPTVQIASAIVSAIQVQEAVKYLCGQEVVAGKQIYYQGKNNDFDIFTSQTRENCYTHLLYYENVEDIPFSCQDSVRSLLEYISHEERAGAGACLSLEGESFSFVESVDCRICGSGISLRKPQFRIDVEETICSDCRNSGKSYESTDSNLETSKKFISRFSLDTTDDELLDFSLNQLGIPFLHVITVLDKDGNEKQYQLEKDKGQILKNIGSKSIQESF